MDTSEREIEQAIGAVAHRLRHGVGPGDAHPAIVAAAYVFVTEWNPKVRHYAASNGDTNSAVYVDAHFPPKPQARGK